MRNEITLSVLFDKIMHAFWKGIVSREGFGCVLVGAILIDFVRGT